MPVPLKPSICNLCGGPVRLTSNAEVYGGRTYGSGKCYICDSCGAYVGTHKPRPDEAMGILADAPMRSMKRAAHELFDARWTTQSERADQYAWLAGELGIAIQDCHFGYFDKQMLYKAILVMMNDIT